MSVTAAIIGGSVIGGIASTIAGKKAGDAVAAGADSAAQATVESTRLQVEELQRQFDAQMKMLGPLIQNQYGAQSAFADLLGFGGYDEKTGMFTSGGPPTSGPNGFVDPNLDPRRLAGGSAQDTEYGQQAFNNVLAPTDPTQDLAIQRADQSRLAAPSLDQDARFQFAKGTEIVGPEFRESPGYAFSVEQGQREVDRKNSAGGNYGGRALLEATRRMQGEADSEYYNYVGARNQELSRQDSAAAAYQGLQAGDVNRGDIALGNYFGRRAGDLTRQDQSIMDNQRRDELDLQRGDQAYYNYLSSLAGAGGFGNPTGQAVGAAGRTGAGISNAYGNEGRSLAGIYTTAGSNQANIQAGQIAGINNALQGGLQNYLFADQAGIT